MVRIPLLDVVAQNKALTHEIGLALQSVASSGRFILGEEVERFERETARYLGVRHAVGVSCGSDALVAALSALEIGPGDEVVTTPFSFFATPEAVLRVGAIPRFVDVMADTLELDANQVEAAIGPRTRAILAVELYGEPGRVDELAAIAERHGVALIEDGAQAFGARRLGKSVGSFGALGCFSFQPTKPLSAWGDAGLVVTSDDDLAARCRRLRVHGATGKHRHREVGGNYRLDALQAAVLNVKLPRLGGYLAARRVHAAAYSEALHGLPGLRVPPVLEGNESSCSVYTLRILNGRRDAVAMALHERGIDTAVHYPLPLYRQPALVERGLGLDEGALPVVEQACREVLSLPLYPELAVEDRERVISALEGALAAVATKSG